MPRANMNEMNIESVNLSHKLWQRVHSRFDLSPVVVGFPVMHEILHLCQLHTLRCIGDRLPVWPSDRRDAFMQIAERRLRHRDSEGPYWCVFLSRYVFP